MKIADKSKWILYLGQYFGNRAVPSSGQGLVYKGVQSGNMNKMCKGDDADTKETWQGDTIQWGDYTTIRIKGGSLR